MAHKLARIHVFNFKSIVNHDFFLNDFTPIVGYNNAGKSNILNSIKWLLKKFNLGEEYFNDLTQRVEVYGVIEGIDDELLNQLNQSHKKSISKYLHNGELHIKRVQFNPNASLSEIKLFIKDFSVNNDDPWVPNPTGIDGAISAICPEPIYIGAMENSEEDVSKSKSSTTIGKLLAEIIGPIEEQHGEHVKDAFRVVKDLLDADGVNRAKELVEFEELVNPKIGDFFPDVKIKAHIPTPEIKEVLKSGTIKVFENNVTLGRDVGSMGHGAQRSIQMALVRHLADAKMTANNSLARTVLLIDEPEIYLHPQAVDQIKDSLKVLSSHGYQVIFTTHSPLMVSAEDILSAIIITKNGGGTERRKTLHQAITQAALDAPSQMNLMFTLTNSSQILFAERIILTEGKTEIRLFPKLFELIGGKSLGYHKCAVINQESVTSTRKSFQVLSALGLPAKAIVDLDYAFTHAERDGFLGLGDADVNACKAIFAQIAQPHGISLGANGLPQRNKDMTPSQAFEILATQPNAIQHIENLHNKLLLQDIWLWKKGSIETHLGLNGKKESVWAEFVHRLKVLPIEQVIPDVTGVKMMIEWTLN